MDEQASRTAVAEHASQLGSWRMEFLAPSERLAPFVRRFNAYAERDTGFARRRELPSPSRLWFSIWAATFASNIL